MYYINSYKVFILKLYCYIVIFIMIVIFNTIDLKLLGDNFQIEIDIVWNILLIEQELVVGFDLVIEYGFSMEYFVDRIGFSRRIWFFS